MCMPIYIYIYIEYKNERKTFLFSTSTLLVISKSSRMNRLMLKLEKRTVKRYIRNYKIRYPEKFLNHIS